MLISVSDTGVGLPPQQGDNIFNAFVTTKTHGTGMGLRISRSIVESHGACGRQPSSRRHILFQVTWSSQSRRLSCGRRSHWTCRRHSGKRSGVLTL